MKKHLIILFSITLPLILTGCFTTLTSYNELKKGEEVDPGKAYLAAYLPNSRGESRFLLASFQEESTIHINFNEKDMGLQLIEIPPGDYCLKGFQQEFFNSTSSYMPPNQLMRLYTFRPGEIIFFGQWGVDSELDHPLLANLLNGGKGSYDINYDLETAQKELAGRYGITPDKMTLRTVLEF